MLVLISGGAASGKSQLAERCCRALGGPLLYIATMKPLDAETRARIARHRTQRAGLGFGTQECYDDLAGLQPDGLYRTGLLECCGNLMANILFGGLPESGEDPAQRAFAGVMRLCEQLENLVVVSNEIFADAQVFDGMTAYYIRALGGLNQMLAQRADVVAEAVCGLPVVHKGEVAALCANF